jgi:hypothetical protein
LTLYPATTFTKYVLNFTCTSDGGQTYGPKTITSASAAVYDDIPNGTWSITAKGFVTINGTEYEAAEGSETITIDGTDKSVGIDISASQSGANGYLYYDIKFPISKVTSASLVVSQFGSNSTVAAIDLTASASGFIDSGASGSGLAPGYYRLDVTLQNDYQRAGVTEIVHIYSNMETRAEYAYTDADFVDFITLSGTITAAMNGAASDSVYISAYTGGSNQNLGSVSISPYSDGETWSMVIPAFESATSVVFSVDLYDSSGSGWVSGLSPTTVQGSDVSGINLSANYASVTLSGTIGAITVNSVPHSGYTAISAYNQNGDYLGFANINSGAWSITVPAANIGATTSIYFEVYVSADGYYSLSQQIAGTTPYTGSDISGIALGNVDFTAVTLSGTIGAITVNSVPYSGYITISAYNQNNDYLGFANINSGAWSIAVSASDLQNGDTISIRVAVDAGDSSVEKTAATRTYSGSNISGIALGNVVFTTRTISGTVSNTPPGTNDGYVLVFAQQLTQANLSGIRPLGGGMINSGDGSWSLMVLDDAPVSLWFAVEMFNETSYRFFAATSAVSTSAAVSLDIGTMTELQLPGN